jgi:hypothetical protein
VQLSHCQDYVDLGPSKLPMLCSHVRWDDPIRTRKNCDDAENLQIGVEVWFTFPRNSELFQSVNDAIQPEKRSRNSELGYMILMRTRALNAQ